MSKENLAEGKNIENSKMPSRNKLTYSINGATTKTSMFRDY